MSNNFYPYDYFCGANVFVTADGQPLLEAAGISYTEMDSMQPIYGYSSRLFDAVAPGQKIIQGSIVLNMVDPDYLFESVNRGRKISRQPSHIDRMAEDSAYTLPGGEGMGGGTYPEVELPNSGRNVNYVYNVGDAWRRSRGVTGDDGIAGSGYNNSIGAMGDMSPDTVFAGLEREYWDNSLDKNAPDLSRTDVRNTDLSLLGPTNIQIEFANDFAVVLVSCFFVSRSSGIQIDENVILEEHTFFARASYTKDL